jgi:glucose/arabinose dehydrogenase
MKRAAATLAGVLLSVGAQAQSDVSFEVQPITSFDQPWAMAFLPDGRMLVTEKKGSRENWPHLAHCFVGLG